jgi:polyhydroxyalkanoate synthesis regulator phasin
MGFSRDLLVRNNKEEGSMDNNNWMQQLVMLGIGTTSLVADKLRQVSDELVKDGKLNPEQAKAVMDDIVQQLRSEQGTWETQMQRQMRNMMQDLGVARQSEVDELRGRIDRLERQVRDLENKLWR